MKAPQHRSGPNCGVRMGSLALGLLLLATGPARALAAKNPFWDRFGEKPVTIEQVNAGGTGQKLVFKDYRDGMLVAELSGGAGEVSLPVSESMARSLRFEFPGRQEVGTLIDDGNYALALERLRPVAYPLIRFVQIPEEFYQIHVPVRMLLEAVTGAGELDEAIDIAGRIPLDRVSPEYSARALTLADALLREKRFAEAAEVVEVLPFGEGYRGNIAPALALANRLRAAEAFEAVIPLYRKILAVAPDKMKTEIRIWLAYSLVLAERLDEAGPLIDSLDEPDPADPLFSLYKLLQGSRFHSEERYRDALDVLTRGFVKSEASYAWVPEMLFLIGDCYAVSANSDAARNTWREITALYPESSWAERARESLASLPESATESNEDAQTTP